MWTANLDGPPTFIFEPRRYAKILMLWAKQILTFDYVGGIQ